MKTSILNTHSRTGLGALQTVDWDFRNAETALSVHSFHPYPARYIPELPRALISGLTRENETVYDPFMGIGTTLLEANRMGRNAIGNDVSELAVLISRVKTTPIAPDALDFLDDIDVIIKDRLRNGVKIAQDGHKNLSYWFKDFVAQEISAIISAITEIKNPDLSDFCRVALSSIIVSVSNQDSDTRYVRVEKDIKQGKTVRRFVNRLSLMKKLMIDDWQNIAKGNSEVAVADTRDAPPFEYDAADLVAFSPPYPNAYDYHLYHKHRFLWLGMDLLFLRRNEMGAHADYSKKNGLSDEDFAKEMEKCLLNISGILKGGRYMAIVVGNSILKGRSIDNEKLIRRVAKKTPLLFEESFERKINLSRKSFNPTIGNIKTEKILLFRNTK